jgi:acetyl esterase/lipase
MGETTGLVPGLFAPEAVDAETAAFNRQLEKLLATIPPVNTVPPAVTRQAREDGKGIFGPLVLSDMATERTIPGPGGDIPLRLFVPETVRGIYYYIHGGGWTIGRAHHQDMRMEAIARNCSVAVVSIDYRLAPEHPYPAGPEDCEAAALWLIEHAGREFGVDRIVIGGLSAGAHLSAVTLIRLRDRHSYTGFAGANLEAGAYDLSWTPSVRRWGERYLVLNTPIIEWFTDQYVPAERRREPDVSPLYADLTSLPPALFTIGTLDPLIDDNLFMHTRWIAAMNKSDLAIYPGGVHGFNGMVMGLAERANARIDAFIRQAIG